MTDKELDQLIQQALENNLDAEMLVQLERELLSNKEACAKWRMHATLHSALETRQLDSSISVSSNIVPIDKLISQQNTKTWRMALATAAAVLIIVGILLSFYTTSSPEHGLTFKSSPNSLFSLDHHDSEHSSMEMAMSVGSQLILHQGSIELEFTTGVKSVVIAPADITLDDHEKLTLSEGTAWFSVPPTGHGFTVHTKELEVVDLGTEFGVKSSRYAPDEVHVFKGAVEATTQHWRKESSILNANEALSVDLLGKLQPLDADITPFLTELPAEFPSYHGPLDPSKGTHSLGIGGTVYTVTPELSITSSDSSLVLDADDSLAVSFTSAVDIQISASPTPDGLKPIWNSSDDFGTITCNTEVAADVYDPNREIKIDSLSEGRFSWMFPIDESDARRDPSTQSWKINLKGVTDFELSKASNSRGRSSFIIHVTNSTNR